MFTRSAISMISPNFVGIGGKKYFGHFTNAPPTEVLQQTRNLQILWFYESSVALDAQKCEMWDKILVQQNTMKAISPLTL
jgi:hypothetical protein